MLKKLQIFFLPSTSLPEKTYTCRFGIRCRCHGCVWQMIILHKRQCSMFNSAYFSLWFLFASFLFISRLFVCRFSLSALKNAVSKKTVKQNYRSPISVCRCLNSFKLIVKTRIDGNSVSCSLFIAYDINKIAALSFILFMNLM